MENYVLTHHGIKGMRWGIRRYQNKNGSLTAAGRKRYGSNDATKKKIDEIKNKADTKVKKIHEQGRQQAKIARAEEKANAKIAKAEARYKTKSASDNQPKTVKDMSDDEIRQKINRIRLENELKSLTPEQVTAGQKFVRATMNDVVAPAAKAAGKKLFEEFVKQKGAELLGIQLGKDGDKKDGKNNNSDELNKAVGELAKSIRKEAKNVSDSVKESNDAAAAKQAKQEAKQAKQESKQIKKEAKREAREELERERETRERERSNAQNRSNDDVETVTGEIVDGVGRQRSSDITNGATGRQRSSWGEQWVDAEFTDTPIREVLDTSVLARSGISVEQFLLGDGDRR